MNEDLLVNVKFVSNLSKLNMEIGKVAPKFTALGKQHVSVANKSLKELNTRVKGFNTLVNESAPAFAGWAMSVMFAGMAIQRIFTQIGKTTTKVFQEISHSLEGNVTKLDILQGSWKYLQFSIGEALDPLFEKLTPIVDKVAEWVEENPKLTATFITLGLVLGTVLLLLGTVKLALDGIVGMKVAIGLLTKGMAGFGVVTGLVGTLLKVAFPITMALLLLNVIYDLGKGIGGFWELCKAVFRGFGRLMALMGLAVIEALLLPLNAVIKVLNGIIKLINKVGGTNIKSISEVHTGGMWEGYLNWEQESFMAPKNGYGTNSATNNATTNIYVNKVETTSTADLMNQLKKYQTGVQQ